ncbi:Red chlorophyll catabolite reductase (RCC reductase) [Cylindrospermum stagnale PCC 7417]|uniref:Red chlorophyll catabolite reductase (RCC reductase) n=1 Tax=Cylindrospermum stagnale PCC 7417 TaxID=56107 RepID=K9WXA7_9NOST|nr:Red chlorophyll catabolite reductase (RCC reductase) [Cylindrospermum stagnale]AFZ24848.1 Red chlorophyll catabolite reductase (RCC reductase) [Cylindrospermum stagnale PCC 7417]
MLKHELEKDNTAIFEQLWGITNELRQKLDARFQVHPDPSTKNLQSYSALTGKAHGSLNTFSGEEIDWLVHSWLRDPQSGFCNMHLSIWLKPHIRVPHLAFAFATVPKLFFYMDYIPRSDLFTNLDYLDRYYEPVNKTYLEFLGDSRFQQYISKTLYIRQAQSHTSLCYTSPVTEETIAVVNTVAHEMMDRWLTWVDEAESVPDDQRAALSERDLIVRRAIAQRDPDNQIAVRLFGEELTDKLVRSLWGADRIL